MSDTRQRLIDVGIERLGRLAPVELLGAVGTRSIAKDAGVSPSAFFHHFRSLDDYAEAVLAELYPTDRSDMAIFAEALALYAESATPVETGQLMFTGGLMSRLHDRRLRTRLGVWALGGAALDAPYGRFLVNGERVVAPASERVYRAWRRELRPPIDLDFVGAIYNAIYLGATIRHTTSPDDFDIERFAQVAMGLTLSFVRPEGDRRSMSDRLAELNYYSVGDRLPSSDLGVDTRNRILDATDDLVANQGLDATSVAAIARLAGVAEATVYAHFGSKLGIGAALFDRQAVAVATTMSVPAGLSAADALGAHLEAVAEVAAPRGETAQAVATLLATSSLEADALLLRTHTAGLVGAALVERSDEAEELADLALLVVLTRAIARPGLPPADLVAPALRLLGVTIPLHERKDNT